MSHARQKVRQHNTWYLEPLIESDPWPYSAQTMAALGKTSTGSQHVAKMQTLEDLATPCFLLYQDRLEANCRAMVQRAKQLGVKLRPHVKTHKTIEAHHILEEIGAGIVEGCVASTMSVCAQQSTFQ